MVGSGVGQIESRGKGGDRQSNPTGACGNGPAIHGRTIWATPITEPSELACQDVKALGSRATAVAGTFDMGVDTVPSIREAFLAHTPIVQVEPRRKMTESLPRGEIGTGSVRHEGEPVASGGSIEPVAPGCSAP